MPVWTILALFLVAAVACPVSMWVMGRFMSRRSACAVCGVDPGGQHDHRLDVLQARKAAIEREIAQAAEPAAKHRVASTEAQLRSAPIPHERP
jgi:hypothetical protein